MFRGQSKKQFRADMFKAKTVLDPKYQYHAVGFRSDGTGVAQSKAKNSKPETVTEDQGYGTGSWKQSWSRKKGGRQWNR